MQETNATVVWPSKLKIGAKSKKGDDPVVFGLDNNVISSVAVSEISCNHQGPDS